MKRKAKKADGRGTGNPPNRTGGQARERGTGQRKKAASQPEATGTQMPPMSGAEVGADVPAEPVRATATPVAQTWPEPRKVRERVPLKAILLIEEDHRQGRGATRVEEMARSLALHGQEVPVRLAETEGGYRMVDGETRRRAAERLGWKEILADVHPAMPDAALHALRAALNLDRLGTTPVDECLAVLATLHAVTNRPEFGQGMTAEVSVAVIPGEVEAVAAALGRSERWVRDRLVLARLGQPVRNLVAAGRLNLGQAREIAKVADPGRQQDLAEMFALEADGSGRVSNLEDCRRAVENARRAIRGTRWDPGVAYAGMPSCLECAHNTAAVNRLFADETSIEGGCCMNAGCFQTKTDAAEKDLAKAVKEALKAKAPATAAGVRPFVPQGLKSAAVARQVEKETETGNGEPARPHGRAGRGTGKGGDKPAPERTPEQKLEEARGKWSERLRNQIVRAMRRGLGKDPKRWAAWNLARYLPEIENLGAWLVKDPRKQADRWRAARGVLKAVAEGNADLAALAAKAVGECRGDQMFFTLHNWSDVALTEFSRLVGVKPDEPPALEEFQKEGEAKVRTCRVCGCTDVKACVDDGSGQPCHWVAPDLCSGCGTEGGKVKAGKKKGRKAAKARPAKDDLPGPDFECDNDCETCSAKDCRRRK